MRSKPKTHSSGGPGRPPTKKSRKVSVEVSPEAVLNLVEVRGQGTEVLKSLIAGHQSKFDWYGEGEYFLCSEEALELLQLSAPIHFRSNIGAEVILDYSEKSGWILKPGLGS